MTMKNDYISDSNQSSVENNDNGNDTFQIIIDIKEHEDKNKVNEIKYKPLKDLEYEVKEYIYSEEYALIFKFSKGVNIKSAVMNPEGITHSTGSGYINVNSFTYRYGNASFKLTLTLSLSTCQSFENLKFRAPANYAAGILNYVSDCRVLKIKDLSMLDPARQTFKIPNDFPNNLTLESLIKSITKSNAYKNSNKARNFFCELIENNYVGKIFDKSTKICQITEFNFFHINVIESPHHINDIESPHHKSSNEAYIRCFICINRSYSEEEKHPYVLVITDDAPVSEIFNRIKEVIINYFKDRFNIQVIFCCIKLHFMNYQIQLNESDESNFVDIAKSLVYPFTNYKNCESLLLEVKTVVNLT